MLARLRGWRSRLAGAFSWRDSISSLVVFLVALPLSMGIAVASGARVEAGMIAAAIGGLVVGALSGAPLQVSGPAAGLTVLVYSFTREHGFALTASATVLGGVLQIVLSRLRVARAALGISPSVIHGMLAGIGVVIVIAQLHVILGGKPQGSAVQNLLELPSQIASLHGAATLLGLAALAILIGWSYAPESWQRLPGPLLAVTLPTVAAVLLGLDVPRVEIAPDLRGFLTAPQLPSWAQLPAWLIFAVTLTLVASAESLLCALATDRLHKEPRADLDRELLAQGVGNSLSGCLGGLPVTGVIVRSAANISSGARTRASTMLHGLWMILFVGLLGRYLGKIPLAVLAALLVHVGARLVSFHRIHQLRRYKELAPYLVTIAGVVAINLLVGIMLGAAVAVLIVLWRMGKVKARIEEVESVEHVRVTGSLTFMGVPKLMQELASLPVGRRVLVDLDVDFLDHTGRDALEGWRLSYERTGGQVYIDGHDFQMTSSPGIERLVEGARAFERKLATRYRNLFVGLAERQTPHTLFLACSDSRVVPSLLTSTDPGELFVVRNVGNMIPLPDGDATPAETAALEFAVGVLGVRDIVVCGHLGCGAMRALREGIPSRFPALSLWLQCAGIDEVRRLKAARDVDEAAKLNVVLQLEHLKSHPIVQERFAAGALRLHGWFFDFRSGTLSEWSPEQQQFVPVGAALDLHRMSDELLPQQAAVRTSADPSPRQGTQAPSAHRSGCA